MDHDRMSVAELTKWLAQLEAQHKEHFKKGVVKKGTLGSAVEQQVAKSNAVRGDCTSFPTPLKSRPIKSPPAPRRNTEGASQFPISTCRRTPIYRDFTVTKPELRPLEEWGGQPDEQLRIVSMKRLLQPPLPGRRQSDSFVGWNASEDYSEPRGHAQCHERRYVSTEECVSNRPEKRNQTKQKNRTRASRLFPRLICKKPREKVDCTDPFSEPNFEQQELGEPARTTDDANCSESNADFNEWLASCSPEGSPIPIRELGFTSVVTYRSQPDDGEHSLESSSDGSASIVLPVEMHNAGCNAKMADVFESEIIKGDSRPLSPMRLPAPLSVGPNNKRYARTARSPGSSTSKTESSSLSSKHSDLKTFTPPRNDITAAIEKFGGRARSTKNPSVKSLQEKLEQKWSEDRAPIYAKKIKWHTKNGTYRKTVGLEYQKK